MTALKYAVTHDDIDTVMLLLEAGADVNLHRKGSLCGENFETALVDAAMCASTDLIELLLDHGSHSCNLCNYYFTAIMQKILTSYSETSYPQFLYIIWVSINYPRSGILSKPNYQHC